MKPISICIRIGQYNCLLKDIQKIEKILKDELGSNYKLFFDTPEKQERILNEVQLALEKK